MLLQPCSLLLEIVYEGNAGCIWRTGTAGPTRDGNTSYKTYAFDMEQEARVSTDLLNMVGFTQHEQNINPLSWAERWQYRIRM